MSGLPDLVNVTDKLSGPSLISGALLETSGSKPSLNSTPSIARSYHKPTRGPLKVFTNPENLESSYSEPLKSENISSIITRVSFYYPHTLLADAMCPITDP